MSATTSLVTGGGPSAEYHAPRELEHPLFSIGQVEAETLVWIQPQWMRPAYELWAGDRVVATLRFKGLSHSEALAASAEGLWTFQRGGMDDGEVAIRQLGRQVAELERLDSVANLLTLKCGATFTWTREGMLGRRWRFDNVIGKPLLYFVPEASAQARLRVELAPDAPRVPQITFLALLGKYLMLGRGQRLGA